MSLAIADAAAKLIPLSQLRERPSSLRGVDKSTEEYSNLVQSVREKGVLESITVRPIPGDPDAFEIVNGLHRYSAACDAGRDTIPCRVKEIADHDILEYQVVANVHKIETKPVEYARAIQAIFAAKPTMTQAEMADKLHKSPSWIAGILNMLRLEKRIAQLVDDGKIKLANGHALAKLPVDEQLKLVDSAMIVPPAEFVGIVNNRLKELREAAKEGKKASEPEFAPVIRLRKVSELKAELDTPNVLANIVKKARTKEEAAREALAWTLGVDKEEVAKQRAAWDARRKLAEQKKAAKAAKKAEEAAEIAAELQTGQADVEAGRVVDQATVEAEFGGSTGEADTVLEETLA